MSKLGERAVVCGAGMGGLLAARVLADFHQTVTVVERDKLSDTVDQRRGVPQGRHCHVLWRRGAQELARLFPGINEELVADGAAVCDDGDLSQVSIRVAGHELHRSGKFSDPPQWRCTCSVVRCWNPTSGGESAPSTTWRSSTAMTSSNRSRPRRTE